MVGLNAITREARSTAQCTEDKREKIQALLLAKECYSMKLELLTNVSQKSKEELKSFSSNSNEMRKNPTSLIMMNMKIS
jgi:hypothetical protein